MTISELKKKLTHAVRNMGQDPELKKLLDEFNRDLDEMIEIASDETLILRIERKYSGTDRRKSGSVLQNSG